MKVLALKTDGMQSYIALYDASDRVARYQWESGRDLARDLPGVINKMLAKHGGIHALQGVVCYGGPGSFTSLRIGHAYVNALAFANDIPIVQESGESWEAVGLQRLHGGDNEIIIIPRYGQEPHITAPKTK